jgi:hypothetical protein
MAGAVQSGTPGSNRRPSRWQRDALPTELVPHSPKSLPDRGSGVNRAHLGCPQRSWLFVVKIVTRRPPSPPAPRAPPPAVLPQCPHPHPHPHPHPPSAVPWSPVRLLPRSSAQKRTETRPPCHAVRGPGEGPRLTAARAAPWRGRGWSGSPGRRRACGPAPEHGHRRVDPGGRSWCFLRPPP